MFWTGEDTQSQKLKDNWDESTSLLGKTTENFEVL